MVDVREKNFHNFPVPKHHILLWIDEPSSKFWVYTSIILYNRIDHFLYITYMQVDLTAFSDKKMKQKHPGKLRAGTQSHGGFGSDDGSLLNGLDV